MRFSNSLFTAAALWGLALLPLGHSRKLPGKISSQKGGGSQKDGGQKGTARIADVGEVRQTMSLVDTLIAEGDFTYLVVIAETLGLQDQLGALQITLFAPDDEAFAALPAGTVDYLLWPENIDALQILLSYHTHIEVKLAADLSDGDELTTFTSTLGEHPRDLTIGVDDVGTVTVDDFATVTKADILNTNGVAHKINEVLVTDLVDIPSMDIVDTAIANNFTTLVAAVIAAGLESVLRVPNGPYTVFAPTDEAFAALGNETLEYLLLPENVLELKGILESHVADGNVYAEDLVDGMQVTMLNGKNVTIGIGTDTVKVNYATVEAANVMALNGIIHVIDSVLLDEVEFVVEGESTVEISCANGQDSGCDWGEGVSVDWDGGSIGGGGWVPEDETSVLYLENSDMDIEGAYAICSVDCTCVVKDSDGVACLLGGETRPPTMAPVTPPPREDASSVPTETTNLPTSPSAPTSSPTAASPGDIVDVAIANGLTTLVTAIKAAGLEDDLREPNGPYTVFAPSEEAFNKVPVYIMEWLLLPENEDSLSSLLLYHVVANRTVFAADLSDGDTIATINGGAVNVTIANATVKINDAVVVMADVMASNGVIHVIDAVLIPPGFDLPDPPTGAPTESPVGDIPAELIGEWIGDSKSSSSFVGSCVNATFAQDGSASITMNTDGYCSQVDIEQAPGDTKGGTISRVECMECSGTYGVFGVKDGSGYAERFNEYEEMDTSCGKLVIEGIQSDGISVEQCVLFKTSLLKKTNERRGLRKMEEEEYIVVNTMTEGPLEPSDVACPADIVYDINKFQHVDFALQTTQLVNQDPGNLVDPSNWKCYSSE